MIELVLASILATSGAGQPPASDDIFVCPGPDPRCRRRPPSIEQQECWDGSRIAVTELCPPRAAPQAAVTLIVFFGTREVALTEEAKQVVEEAATLYSRRGAGATIRLQAHTDRHGPADENLTLSRRYGEAVRDYLVALGVPPGAITIQALGETEPLVPTADGEREPQNRRVTIDLSGAPAG